MNAGMYGLPDGRGMQGRKLAGQLGRDTTTAVANVTGFGGPSGALPSNVSGLTESARNLLLNVTGRGASRFLAVALGGSGTGLFRVEVVLDGVTVASAAHTAAHASGVGFVLFGHVPSSTHTGIWDYVPFDSSLQVFVTLPPAVTSAWLLQVTDIHQ